MPRKSHSRNWLDFERYHQPLLPSSVFVRRLFRSLYVSVGVLVIWIGLGICGYHFLANLSLIDAFLNTTMIVGGMGPVDILPNDSSKLFAGVYAVLSGVVFLGLFGFVIAPIFHRFLHRFHLEDEVSPDSEKTSKPGKKST